MSRERNDLEYSPCFASMPWPPDLPLPLLLPHPFLPSPVLSACVCHLQAHSTPSVCLDLTLCDATAWKWRGGSPVRLPCLFQVASNDVGLKNCRSVWVRPLPSDFLRSASPGSHHRHGVRDFYDLTSTGFPGKLLCFQFHRSACSRYGFLFWTTVHVSPHD